MVRRNNLRIATWNANGIKNKTDELEIFLNEEDIDVCLLSETHLTNSTDIKVKGYNLYKANHPLNQPKGGSAVIAKQSITQNEGICLQQEEIQLSTVDIKTNNLKLTIGAVYCPPRYNLKQIHYEYLLNQSGDRFIIGGDYNAKHTDWGSRQTSTKGKELREALRNLGCNYHSTGNATYWPSDTNKIPDLLDFFITKKVSPNFIHLEDSYDLSSDHSAVILNLSEKVIKKQSRPSLVNNSTDWNRFSFELENLINLRVQIRNETQLDEEAELFVKNIQKAAWNNTKQRTLSKVCSKYPREILEIVREKRRARRKWHQTRNPADKNHLNSITQKLKRAIQKMKHTSFQNYLKHLNPTKEANYSLWKAANKIKRCTKHMPPIRKNDNNWAKDNKEKADAFADHLFETFKPNEIISDIILDNVENTDNEMIELVSQTEVMFEIKNNLNPKKAPGFELITGKILKQFPKKAVSKLTNLINASIRLKYVPSVWKVAEIIMLHKPGKPPNEVKSYRPISLLPIISKVFEKILLKRLKPIIERRGLIPNHQFGFRDRHSTIDQVHRLTDLIEKSLEQKKICSAMFLDVAQAFDKVWHEGLLHKLKSILPGQYVELLRSYLSNRTFRVRQEDEYSNLKEIRAGVPQGSILGPFLYVLYTSDLPQPTNVMVATFADDTALLAVGENINDSTNILQRASDDIFNWTKSWKIKLNESKSVHINFTNKKISSIPAITLNGVTVPYANTAKYLGMTLDAKLRWKVHVKKKRNELDSKYREIYWLLERGSKVSTQNKILIYNQILKPVWTYGIQLWGCAKTSNINIIQTWQNKVLRNIVNAPWYVRNNDLHRDLGIAKINSEIKKHAAKHELRLQQHTNVEATKLLDRENLIRRLKRTKPFELI